MSSQFIFRITFTLSVVVAPLSAAAATVKYRFEAVLDHIVFYHVYDEDEEGDIYLGNDYTPLERFAFDIATFGATRVGDAVSGSLLVDDSSSHLACPAASAATPARARIGTAIPL